MLLPDPLRSVFTNLGNHKRYWDPTVYQGAQYLRAKPCNLCRHFIEVSTLRLILKVLGLRGWAVLRFRIQGV